MHDDSLTPAGDSTQDEPSFAGGRILVVALQGWNDAGESATAAVGALEDLLGELRPVATIDDEHYFDYSINRPHVVRGADGERVIDWPSVDVLGPDRPGDTRSNLAGDAELRVTADNVDNVYVMSGPEPTLQWRRFADEVMRVCEAEAITRVVLVGALLADVPHTRPIGVFVSSEDASVREEFDVGRSNYQGPTGVLSVLGHAARRHGMRAASIWASVPHYAHQSPSPKATLAILDKLEEVLDITIPRAELTEQARSWEDDVDAATEQDPEIVEYVGYLERAYDTVEAPEASGEAIAKEFERFLRSGDGRSPGTAQQINSGNWTGPVPKPGPTPSGRPGATDGEVSPDTSDGEDGDPADADATGDGPDDTGRAGGETADGRGETAGVDEPHPATPDELGLPGSPDGPPAEDDDSA